MRTAVSAIILGSFLLLSSCSKKDDDTALTTTQEQQQAVSSGTWKVTLFTDSGNNETSSFSGINFQFNSSGVIMTSGALIKAGTWNITQGSNRFNIDLGPKVSDNEPLGELTDDWVIISISSNEIKLTDDNASSNEFLTFQKN